MLARQFHRRNEDEPEQIQTTERKALSKAIRDARRERMVRKVYVLPSSAVAGIIRYQARQMLPSEVSAFRSLLDIALTRVESHGR